LALEVYRKKRKFQVTPEPRGHKAARGGDRYVIQKHAARRLHYDLRLELDGVMKSWAVTRGPSLDPGQKRLAVEVEDHPIEYNRFEGTIPQGEYGGGTVMIWDRGTWSPEGDPHRGFAKGHLDFELHGDKLHGRWHLVRMRGRPNESHRNWLLIKSKDDYSRTAREEDILAAEPLSAVSGRSMEEIAAGKGKKRVWHSNRAGNAIASADSAKQKKPATKPASKATAKSGGRARAKAAASSAAAKRGKAIPGAKAGAGKARLPDFVPPSLATLHATAPRGKDWLHEIKFDGYRIEARLDHGSVKLLTRNRQDWTHRYAPIAAAVAKLPATTALLDGELVVEDENGVSSFSLLQADQREGRSDRFVYYVFDLLHLDGSDLTKEPLIARKAALERLLKGTGKKGRIRYAGPFDEDGGLIFKRACELHLEGIVSKRRDAPYRSGRTDNFIKIKCHNEQEFVVAGFTPSAAMPKAVGALSVAFHDKGALRYAGRIGTGFTHKTARELWRRLDALRVERAPVTLPKDERRKNVIWVKPVTVIEAEFRGLTGDGLLRQASYKGLREDKPAREVVRETPVAAAPAAAAPAASRRPPVRKSGGGGAMAKKPPSKENAALAGLHLTHPDRVYWVDVGVTKEDLAEYYLSVWDWMAPHIVGRPLALVRCPDGTKGQCFFQKHVAANVKHSPLRHAVAAKEHDVIAVESRDDLIALVQSGALEIHVRGSRLDALEKCDRVVFDLDPGDGVSWAAIVAAARETRDRLSAEKLKSFAKLSGGKGIHVVVPVADADWDLAKNFSQRIALGMAADSPQRYVGKMTKALRKGRIFIDYFRNSREATSVAAYSTRARPGAAVSAPLSWEQLSRTKSATDFTLLNLKKHFRADPWADIGKVRQRLPGK
jgi:bifunctional non-homologous end joining protein LigD